jgi:hypothetical protein
MLANDALKLSDRQRAQQATLLTLRSDALAASDRVLVCDFPPVSKNRHHIIPAINAWFTASWAATLNFSAWIVACPPSVNNFGTTSKTPATGGIADTTTAFDMANRPTVIVSSLDPIVILPDQAHCVGVFAAGGGEKGGFILPAGWFIRLILAVVGTADAVTAVRPFPPTNAVLQGTVTYIEESTLVNCETEL